MTGTVYKDNVTRSVKHFWRHIQCISEAQAAAVMSSGGPHALFSAQSQHRVDLTENDVTTLQKLFESKATAFERARARSVWAQDLQNSARLLPERVKKSKLSMTCVLDDSPADPSGSKTKKLKCDKENRVAMRSVLALPHSFLICFSASCGSTSISV